jgi:hypothetical protein
MKSFSSILAWLLLIGVLAVPSFLFYNWWSKSSKQSSAEVTPGPVTVNVFPSDERSPSAAAQAPAAQQPAPEPQASPRQEPAQRTSGVISQEEAEPEEAVEETAEPQPPAAAAAAAPAADAAAPAQEQAVDDSTVTVRVSHYEPKGDRDPTLSPEDYRRIKELRRQREEAERMRRMAERSKPREPSPDTYITLQGIVGNAAIINGDMVNVGQTVRGVKIVKIGADYIIGEQKGKRFKKVLR